MDFREYIQFLDEKAMLQKINDEVHWKYEIGTITRKMKNKAILFNNIKDYKNCQLFTGGLATCEYFALLLNAPFALSKKK